MRDLNEVFASALEHGETEQQVIERLGTTKEFAENTAEQLGTLEQSMCRISTSLGVQGMILPAAFT